LGPLKKEVARDGKNKENKDRLDGMEKIYDWVAVQKKEARFGDWSSKEIDYVNDLHLLTSKPALHLINLSQEDFLRKKNKWLAKIKEGRISFDDAAKQRSDCGSVFSPPSSRIWSKPAPPVIGPSGFRKRRTRWSRSLSSSWRWFSCSSWLALGCT
jgi:hypothetical protein